MRRRRRSIARERRRARFIRTISIVAIVFLILSGLSIYGMWQEQVRIQSIEITGTEVLQPIALVEKINIQLSGVRLVVPRNSIFFFPKSQIKESMKQQFPRIDNIIIRRTGFAKIQVLISERVALAQWCGVSIEQTQDCFLVDKTGFIFAQSEKQKEFISMYGNISQQNPLRSIVYAQTAVPRTLLLKDSLSLNDVGVFSIFFREGDEVDLELENSISVKYLLGEESFVAEALPQLLSTEEIETIQSIDMRFGKRVYIKRRE